MIEKLSEEFEADLPTEMDVEHGTEEDIEDYKFGGKKW